MNISAKLALCPLLAMSFMLMGCVDANIQKSDGSMVNTRNGKPAQFIQLRDETDSESHHMKNGSEFKLLSFSFEDNHLQPWPKNSYQMDNAYELALFYPTNLPNHLLRTQTGSNDVYACLVRNELTDPVKHFADLGLPDTITRETNPALGQAIHLPIWNLLPWWAQDFTDLDLPRGISSFDSPANLDIPGSEPLHGRIEIKRGSWLHRNYFYAGMDLADNNGLALNGDYKSYDKMKFAPIYILLGLAYVIDGGNIIF
jgi:hypothetical protein